MKKSQGEIFGIALLFVIIIIGVLIYGQIQANKPQREVDVKKEAEYSLLAQSTLNSLKKISTGCQVERGDDSLEALITYCMDFSSNQDDNPQIICNNDEEKLSCSYAIQIINNSLQNIFHNQTPVIGHIPFSIDIFSPDYGHTVLNGTPNNMNSFISSGNQELNLSNYIQSNYKRVSSGRESIPTQKRAVEIILSLYYR